MKSFVHDFLKWDVNQVKTQSCFCSARDKNVPFTFDTASDYKSFLLAGVMEEAWGTIHNALMNNTAIEFSPTSPRFCTLVNDPDEEEGFSLISATFAVFHTRPFQNIIPNTVVEMQCRGWSGFGLIYVNKGDEGKGEVIVKLLLPTDIYEKFRSPELSWQIRNLRVSVTPKLRMHQSLCEEVNVSFLEALIKGVGGNAVKKIWMQDKPQTVNNKKNMDVLFSKLNPSQKVAMKGFYEARDGELQVLHGPPGTGKTTALSCLIQAFWQNGTRCLVSSPSNKAVRVLARKFLTDCKDPEMPFPPVVILSASEKLSLDDTVLNGIFVDNWASFRLMRNQEIMKSVQELLHKLTHLSSSSSSCAVKDILSQDNKIEIESARAALSGMRKEILRLCPDWGNKIANQLKVVVDTFRSILTAFVSKNTNGKRKHSKSKITETNPDPTEVVIAGLTSITNSLEEVNKLWQCPSVALPNELCNHAVIVFSTLSVLGRQNLRRTMRSFEKLIIDEAAQSTESEMCIAFYYNPKNCLLVGDVKQLPATVISSQAEAKGFGRSAMDRLMKTNFGHLTLSVQYRMHPDIFEWSNKQFYNNEIQNGIEKAKRKTRCHKLKGFGPFSVINCPDSMESKVGSSYINHVEALSVAEVIKTLKEVFQVDIKEKVSVLTFYKAQVENLRTTIHQLIGGDIEDVPGVHSVDSFQGCENDFILLSTVRAHSNIGFVSDFRRLNVALTRAKYSLIMFGHLDTLASNTDHDISNLVQDSREKGFCHEWINVQDAIANYEDKGSDIEDDFDETAEEEEVEDWEQLADSDSD